MTTPQPAPWQQSQAPGQADPYLLALQGIRSTVDKIYTLMVVAVILGVSFDTPAENKKFAVILGVVGGLLAIFRGISG